MAAPTLAQVALIASSGTVAAGGTLATASVSWQSGDVIVVMAGDEGQQGTWSVPTTTGSGITLTAQQVHNSAGSNCGAGCWAGVATAASSGTFSVKNENSNTAQAMMAGVYVVRGSAGIGNSAMSAGSSSRTVSLTPSGADGLIIWGVFDWSQSAVQSPTPAATSHASGSPGPTASPLTTSPAGRYTGYLEELDDQTASTAVSYGIGGSGTGPYTIIAIEVQASAGGGSTPISVSDTGSGDDEISVSVSASPADTGHGTDAITVSATVPPLADTASGTDAFSVSPSVPLADAVGGTDAFSVGSVTAPLSDTGHGTEALTASVTTSGLTDAGTATDALTVTVPIPLSDTGHGTDTFGASATVPLADTGSGTDALGVTVTVSLSDTGTATDAITVSTGTPKSVSDTGSGTDAFTVTATVPLAETAAGTDAITISALTSLTDTASAADAISVVRLVSLSDSVTATDAISVTSGVPTNSGSASIGLSFSIVAYDDSMRDGWVYLYTPPTWRYVGMVEGSLRCGITTSTLVYRMNGVWFNQLEAGVDNPVVADVDVDPRSGMRLFFTKPMVVPGWLYDELYALEPADPSWSPGTLTLL